MLQFFVSAAFGIVAAGAGDLSLALLSAGSFLQDSLRQVVDIVGGDLPGHKGLLAVAAGGAFLTGFGAVGFPGHKGVAQSMGRDLQIPGDLLAAAGTGKHLGAMLYTGGFPGHRTLIVGVLQNGSVNGIAVTAVFTGQGLDPLLRTGGGDGGLPGIFMGRLLMKQIKKLKI